MFFIANIMTILLVFLKEYLSATGSACLTTLPEEDQSEDDRNFLKIHLLNFSKFFVSNDEACRNEGWDDMEDQIIELCKCLISLSRPLLSNAQSIGTLPDFFSDVRKFAKRNYTIFSPRNLTSMHNSLKESGPFTTSPSLLTAPSYLFAQEFVPRQAEVSFEDANDDAYLSRVIVVSKTALYTFKQSANPENDSLLGILSECIPLKFVTLEESEMDLKALELNSISSDQMIPFFKFNASSNYDYEDNSSLQFCNCVFVRLEDREKRNEINWEIEESLWDLVKAKHGAIFDEQIL